MEKLARVGRLIKDTWLIVGITLFLFGFLEGSVSLAFLIKHRLRGAERLLPDWRVEADTYADRSWVKKYDLLLGYLNRIGVTRDSLIGASGASLGNPPSAYLYDLSGGGGDTGTAPGQGDAGERVEAPCDGGPKVPRPTPGVDAYW